MLVRGDFSLDSIQMCSASFKEALKQAMLSQEVMFRKQVLDLHQLCGVQRVLMHNFVFEEFNRCSFKKAGIKSTSMPCANPARYDSLVKETEVSSTRMLEKHPAKNYELRPRPLDLQLPADQYVSLIEEGRDSISTVSGTSTCNGENDSGGEKRVQNLSIPMSNQCCEAQKGLHSAETIFFTEKDRRSSSSIESEHDEESSETKVLLQNAVASLICMSLADSAVAHNCNTRTESNEMGRYQVDQPQSSCDSFELLVLKQAENDEDDEFSASSRLSEVTDMDIMNFSVELRWGRRLKDFQREMLPGLSCLSRHEICEDINIMEAVLRSREYRTIRARAKMQDGQKGCAPTKSKRSRLNNTRRRINL